MSSYDLSFLSQRRPLTNLVEDPYDRQLRELTLADLAQQRDLHAFTLGEKKRGAEDDETLARQYVAATMAGMTPEARRAAIAASGRAAPTLAKKFAEDDKARVEVDEKKASAKKHDVDAKSTALKGLGGVAFGMRDNPDLGRLKDAADFFNYTLPPFRGDPNDLESKKAYANEIANLSFNAHEQRQAELTAASQAETKDYHGQETQDRRAALAQGMTIAQMNDARQRENAAATRDVAAATREGAKSQQVTTNIAKVRDDYRAESKGWSETARSMSQVNAALNTATSNPASALAAGTGFMKILDPTSVVRETELVMALNASGALDRLRNAIPTLQHGKVMTPEQVANMRVASNTFFAEAAAVQRKIDARYAQMATDLGGKPEHVVMELGQRDAGMFKAKNGGTVGPGQ